MRNAPCLLRSISYAAEMRAPAIVHLIGFPASGKLTIAHVSLPSGAVVFACGPLLTRASTQDQMCTP